MSLCKRGALLLGVLLIFTVSVFEIDQSPTLSAQTPTLSYGLVIDTSGSLRSQIEAVIATGKLIVKNNKKGDETFLVRFVDRKIIQITTDFTNDPSEIEDGLDSLYPQGGQTAVIDAVYSAALHLAEHTRTRGPMHRRVLILITDGEDRESFHKADELIDMLSNQKIKVYVVGLVGRLKKDRGEKIYQRAVAFLNSLAKGTGGTAFFPNSLPELTRDANEIINAVHN